MARLVGSAADAEAFELLALLVRERHRALTKQELFEAVWPDIAVTENTLTQRIKEIRQALGDRAHEQAYIRTIPRVGFQFVADVAEVAPGAANEAPVPEVGAALISDSVAETTPPTAAAHLPPNTDTAVRPSRLILLSTAAIALAASVAALIYWARQDPAGAGSPNRRVMLAILPFENLSGDPEQEYIADGLTEEMIAELGRLDPARLGVIARTSVMTYRSTTKRVAEIARELGVDFVLEGSVRREADRVRIVAQLIRASDQTHIWAERYDRDMRSILSLRRSRR